jgi:dolichol-phosphate mannosyltransferase
MDRTLESADLTNVTSVLAFASYNEKENLARLLGLIGPHLSNQHMIIIADDSGQESRALLEHSCLAALGESKANICFSYAELKSGRGAAIRRSFAAAIEKNPNISWFLESDSDGSHRPEDIVLLLNSSSNADLLIGSRYSNGSRITGWPIGRRIFSKVLNLIIPKVLNVKARDLTNGLRRYSNRAVSELLRHKAENNGFIYLSEVAYLLSREGFFISDTPIHFENRVFGESTVGRAEIIASLAGLGKLIVLRIRNLANF